MRFFTDEVIKASEEDVVAFRRACENYAKHLASLSFVLPPEVLQLAQPSGMEDGLIYRIDLNFAQEALKLTMRCGHLQMGYYDLEIHYLGVEISSESLSILHGIISKTLSASDHENDLEYHEIDVAPGGLIEHRFRFYPRTIFSIRCKSLTWLRSPQPNREFKVS